MVILFEEDDLVKIVLRGNEVFGYMPHMENVRKHQSIWGETMKVYPTEQQAYLASDCGFVMKVGTNGNTVRCNGYYEAESVFVQQIYTPDSLVTGRRKMAAV